MSEFDELFNSPCQIQVMNPTEGKAPLMTHRKVPNIPGYANLQQERPNHRAIIQMSAEGYTNREIAAKTGMHEVSVSNILRAPVLQQVIADESRRRHGTDEQVVEVIRGAVVDAVEMLHETIKDDNCKRSDRIAAAAMVLDRRYGKPNQPINRDTDIDLNAASIAELASQLPLTEKTGTSDNKTP